MRDIVPKVSEERASHEHHEQRKISRYINHFEVPDITAMKHSYDMDQESVSSQDSGTSSTISAKSDVPTYRSFQKYLDGYSTLKFKTVRPGNILDTPAAPAPAPAPEAEPMSAHVHAVDGAAAIANKDDARTHKAEIMIQVQSHQPNQYRVQQQNDGGECGDKRRMAAPPPPPPAMPLNVPPAKLRAPAMCGTRAPCVNSAPRVPPPQHDLKTCLLDELKAKHPPKEYQCHNQEVPPCAYTRRTSEPINTPARHQATQVVVLGEQQHQQPAKKPPPPPLAKTAAPPPPLQTLRSNSNSLPRHWSGHRAMPTTPPMLSNPDAQTVTRVPSAKSDAAVNRNDPNVKKLVYATLRNYVGAYNNRANLMVAQHGNVVQDKGVTAQIKSITASGNLSHVNGRINPKENE